MAAATSDTRYTKEAKTPIARVVAREARPVVANGVALAELDLELPGNALVRAFELRLQADRASWTLLDAAGQTRAQVESEGDTAVVVEFGTPCTVSAVGVIEGSNIEIFSVRIWDGTKFADPPLFPESFAGPPSPVRTGVKVARFPAEVRTERLQIVVLGDVQSSIAERQVAVEFPSAPADLELRINDGPPVFTHPGPVESGRNGWLLKGERTLKTVSIASALSKLTSDPANLTSLKFHLTLSARSVGVLALEVLSQDLGYLIPTDLGPGGTRALVFDAEGMQSIALDLPSDAKRLDELRVTLAANLPRERVLPPLGPARAGEAELLLDAQRSAVTRLQSAAPLAEITAVRVPLRAGSAGAEVRVMLLSNVPVGEGDTGDTGEPGAAIDGAISKPVNIEPGLTGDSSDSWLTFAFPVPVPVKAESLPWVAVQVARGSVTWYLAAFAALSEAMPVRRGPPVGPFVALPGVFATQLAHVGGRVRAVGHAKAEAPLAPLSIDVAVAGADPLVSFGPSDATPTAKGSALVWPGPLRLTAGTKVDLRVTSRVTGTVTVKQVVSVISKT